MSRQAAETTVPVIMNGTKVELGWDVCVWGVLGIILAQKTDKHLEWDAALCCL